MEPLVLSAQEQEYLLRIIEAAAELRDARDFFLWSSGQLQTLLPHALMVALQFDADGALVRSEALHAALLAPALLARVCEPEHGVAARLARHWRAAGVALAAGQGGAFAAELAACGFDNAIVHGSGPVAGGASVFALFGLAPRATPRHLQLLALLLPQLHLALGRLAGAGRAPGATARALSARETQILHYLRDGKKNAEIGAQLGISALTVKNHLQRIYPLLGARNRTEAVAPCAALRLLARQ